MADGTYKPIEDIGIGELVLATDPETGNTQAQVVEDVITGVGEKALVQIAVASGSYPVTATGTDTTASIDQGSWTATITATDGHPFWDAGQATWVDATDLTPGVQLATPSGAYVTIQGVGEYDAVATVHNLTISGYHTYYVLAGDTPVLVHNAGSRPCGPGDINVNDLRFSRTVENHLGDITRQGNPARPFMRSPLTMREIMRGSTPRPDPAGVPGAWRWDTPGAFNGKPGTWELVVDARTNTVLHYNFTTR